NRATFEQIKYSGSLRYFKNYRLLDKMIEYDAAINRAEAEYMNHRERGNMLLDQINNIIDPLYHKELSPYFLWTIDSIPRETKDKLLSVELPSLENKREVIN